MRALLAVLAALIAALVLWQLWPEAAATTPQAVPGRGDVPVAAADPTLARTADRVAAHAGDPPALAREEVAAPAGWTLHGEVKRGYRDPFPGARVIAEWFDGFDATGTPRRVTTVEADGSGEFTLALPLPDRVTTLRVRSDVPGAKQGEETLLALPGRRLPEEVELSCFPIDGVLAGHVVDDEGRPIRSARVVIRAYPPEQVTAADGRFRFTVSSASSQLSLQAAAPGFALAVQRVPAPAPGTTAETEIVLSPGATLRGRVVDEQGVPVEGAKVQTFFTLYYGSVTTGPDGTFVLDYLDPGRELDGIYARKTGYVLGRVDYNLRQPKASYEILLRRGVRVTGVVVDAGGAPIPGATLYIGFDPSAYDRLDAPAREGGRFEFAPVAPGEHDLVVECTGYATDVRKIQVPPEPERFELTVRLQTGREIGGMVVDAAGKPLADIGVHAREASGEKGHPGNGRYIGQPTSTDAEGRFRIVDMPGPAIDIEFYGRDVIRHVAANLGVGRDDHRIALQRAARLAGRVVDARSGAPIEEFRVRFLRAGTGGYGATWVREGVGFRSKDGTWKTDSTQLTSGAKFLVEVAARGYGRAVREVTTATDPDPDAAVFSLMPGRIVRGRVIAADTGLPLPRARVAMFDEHHPLRGSDSEDHYGRITDTTSADGTFELRDVPIGKVSLAVDCEGRPRASDGPFEVGEHAIVERVILLQPPGQIRGIAVDGEGRPLAGARVWIHARGVGGRLSANETVVCGADGRFESSATLPSGLYDVSMSAPPRGEGMPVLLAGVVHALAAGERAELRLCPTAAGRLRLQFRSQDGVPLGPELRVNLMPIGGDGSPRPGSTSYSLDAPASGVELLGLVPGRYSMHVGSGDGRFAQRVLEVGSGSAPAVEIDLRRH